MSASPSGGDDDHECVCLLVVAHYFGVDIQQIRCEILAFGHIHRYVRAFGILNLRCVGIVEIDCVKSFFHVQFARFAVGIKPVCVVIYAVSRVGGLLDFCHQGTGADGVDASGRE